MSLPKHTDQAHLNVPRKQAPVSIALNSCALPNYKRYIITLWFTLSCLHFTAYHRLLLLCAKSINKPS